MNQHAREMQRVNEYIAATTKKAMEDAPWYAEHPEWVVMLASMIFVAQALTAWHCLATKRGIDRLTWLVAIIGLPVFGIVFYMIHGSDTSSDSDRSAWEKSVLS